MGATVFVMDISPLMQEDVLQLHMEAALPRRREKALHMRQREDRARCIGAGILLARAYDYYCRENRESAEADSLVVFADERNCDAGGPSVTSATATDFNHFIPVAEDLPQEKTAEKAWMASQYGEMAHVIPCDLAHASEKELLEALPKVLYTEKGKPYFAQGPCFNLSHAGHMTVCAMAPYPIGIDVEKVRPCREAVMKRCFREKEILRVRAAEDDLEADRTFSQIWTHKEALAKLTGNGIADIFQMGKDGAGEVTEQADISFYSMWLGAEYVLTVAKGLPSAKCHRQSPGQSGQNSRPKSGYPCHC